MYRWLLKSFICRKQCDSGPSCRDLCIEEFAHRRNLLQQTPPKLKLALQFRQLFSFTFSIKLPFQAKVMATSSEKDMDRQQKIHVEYDKVLNSTMLYWSQSICQNVGDGSMDSSAISPLDLANFWLNKHEQNHAQKQWIDMWAAIRHPFPGPASWQGNQSLRWEASFELVNHH
jgi:hypothetical protein